MQEIIGRFGGYLYQLGYGRQTRQCLCAQAAALLAYCEVTDITQITQGQVKDFYEWLYECPGKRKGSCGLSEGTIAHYVYALQHFFSWLEQTEQIQYNPISGIKFKQHHKNRREPLSREQIEALFAATRGLQELAVLHLFYSCGLRRNEAVQLDTRDIHFKQQLLYVREGKGGKRRVIPLTARVAHDLENYYSKERCQTKPLRVSDEAAFMLNSRGMRMSGEGYQSLFKKIMARCENEALPTNTTLHHLRHSIATALVQGGMGMGYVKDFLGHSSLDTTQVYARAKQIKSL
ncbi:MAG: tyrosine-type recombinase/integrase [Sediminibacterium magnilacihabitans]|jgi:integrase/recombinase XerD|nr:tyrosine-type recombinase/integrase [Sediminibacterium magnilacihabitans]PQV56131.1 integrase/recombinase XerD [Sediminibacterium magnilacihabitans]